MNYIILCKSRFLIARKTLFRRLSLRTDISTFVWLSHNYYPDLSLSLSGSHSAKEHHTYSLGYRGLIIITIIIIIYLVNPHKCALKC